MEIRRLSAADIRRFAGELANVLVDCVEGGASVSFMLPFSQLDAEAYFLKIAADVEAHGRILLAAFHRSRIAGTVQIVTALPPNQPHRAEIAKLLVHRSMRGEGVGRSLMEEAERQAVAAGKKLLVLDTASGEAQRLYERLHWVKAGVIPDFALFPDGRWTDTTIYWKKLGS